MQNNQYIEKKPKKLLKEWRKIGSHNLLRGFHYKEQLIKQNCFAMACINQNNLTFPFGFNYI